MAAHVRCRVGKKNCYCWRMKKFAHSSLAQPAIANVIILTQLQSELKEYGVDMIRDLREARLAVTCVGGPICVLYLGDAAISTAIYLFQQQKFQLNFHPRGGENVF